MKTTFSFGLIVAAAGTLFACSDEGEGECRTNCGGTGNVTATAGTGNNTGGTGNGTAGNAGSPAVGGAGGAAPSVGFPGTPLEIDAEGNVVDPSGRSGINGAALLASSAMNPAEELVTREGALCIVGETAIVPGMDYDNYWGAEIDLDLNRVANPDATDAGGAATDAGAGDAGVVLGQVAQPWDPNMYGVIGFSFKVEGQDPTIVPGEGVPAAFRFKTAPSGGNTSTDNFCVEPAPVHNGLEEIPFTQLTRDCWAPGGASVFEDPAGFTAVNNIGWQIPASTTIAYRFNFCITELTPIFATAAP